MLSYVHSPNESFFTRSLGLLGEFLSSPCLFLKGEITKTHCMGSFGFSTSLTLHLCLNFTALRIATITFVKSKIMISKLEDYKIFKIKITRSQKNNEPKKDHKKQRINIMCS